MEATPPLLSASLKSSSVEPSPPTPFSLDMPLLSASPRKRPMDHLSRVETRHFSAASPPHGSRIKQTSTTRKRTVDAHKLMKKMFIPPKHRIAPVRPLELRFAMRSLDRTSHTSLSLSDVIEVSFGACTWILCSRCVLISPFKLGEGSVQDRAQTITE